MANTIKLTAYNDWATFFRIRSDGSAKEYPYEIDVNATNIIDPLNNGSYIECSFTASCRHMNGRFGNLIEGYQPTITITINNTKYTINAYPQVPYDDYIISGDLPIKVSADGGKTITDTYRTPLIPHNADGSKTITFTVKYDFNGLEILDSAEEDDDGNVEYIYYHTWWTNDEPGSKWDYSPQTASTNWVLTTVSPVPSTLSCPVSYIGNIASIGVLNKFPGLTHTLTYEFNGLTGTITQKTTSNNIKWLIPTSFYSHLTDNKTGTCIVHCITYTSDGAELGRTQNPITIAVSDDNAPLLSPIVEELENKAFALTGNKDVLVRYYSGVNFAFNAIAQNGATIKDYLLTYGAGRYTIPNGQIGYIESDTFTFKATDTRGLTTTSVIKKQVIPYFRPTCYIIRKSSSPEGNLVINIKGNCFNGSFGLVDNDLTIKYRYKVSTDDYFSEWEEVVPTRNENNTYIAEVAFPYLDYRKTYVFEAVATDTIFSTTSQETRIDFMPVFDWSLHDFNFNIDIYGNGMEMIRPYNENGVMNIGYGGYREGYGATNIFGNEVNIETNDTVNLIASSSINLDANDNVNMNAPLVMNGTTVLRHNSSASNLVISTDGGSIFFRPNGDESGTAEVRIYPDGVVKITGDIVLNGVSLADKLGI
jgi:hypothetical protein